MSDEQELLLSNYAEIRERYRGLTQAAPASQILTDPHGLYRVSPNYLSQQFAGFDKLFLTLVEGIVEDPDFALRKDSRIYERMMRDPQVYYCLAVRRAATAGLSWSITPPDSAEKDPQAQEVASAAERRIRRIPQFNELLDNILDAFLSGLSVNELCWQLVEKEYVITEHYPRNKDRFVFDKDGNPRLRTRTSPTTGVAVPPYKFVVHRFNISDGSWARPDEAGYIYFGRGLADTPLYHYFYFKVQILRFMMRALERYGTPQKIFYTSSQSKALTDRVHEILSSLENDASVVIPGKKGEVNVDVAKAMVSAQMFSSSIEYIDRLITRSILGQELMTEMPETGSYAAAQVHASVFDRITESDRLLVQDTLNRSLMLFDTQLNTPKLPEALRPRFEFRRAPRVDIPLFLQSVAAASRLGVEVSEVQFRELTGLREPREGEGVIGGMEQQIMQQQQQQQMMQQQQQQQQQQPEALTTSKPGAKRGE